MPAAMRLEPRDSSGRRLARIEIDERARPPRVAIPPAGGDLFLRWDEALDDSGSLRRCVVCGCAELYARKSLPQVTPFVVVLALSGTVVAVLGYANDPVVFALLAALLVVDVLTLALARRQLVCYGCGALYERLRIARYHRRWERSVAERVQRQPVELPTLLDESRTASGGGGTDPAGESLDGNSAGSQRGDRERDDRVSDGAGATDRETTQRGAS